MVCHIKSVASNTQILIYPMCLSKYIKKVFENYKTIICLIPYKILDRIIACISFEFNIWNTDIIVLLFYISL